MAHCLSVSSLAGTLSHILHLFTAQLKLYMVQTPYTVYMDHFSSVFFTTGGVDKTTLVHRAINCKCIWENVCVCALGVQVYKLYKHICAFSVLVYKLYKHLDGCLWTGPQPTSLFSHLSILQISEDNPDDITVTLVILVNIMVMVTMVVVAAKMYLVGCRVKNCGRILPLLHCIALNCTGGCILFNTVNQDFVSLRWCIDLYFNNALSVHS